MPSHTVTLHRVLRASPEKVYKAFLDPDALTRWIAPYGFVAKVHHLNPSVGGTFRMSFVNFGNGQAHSFGGEYLELRPGEFLRYTDKFDDPNLQGELVVTVELRKVSVGTEMLVTQSGIPIVIPQELCYLGWQESLAQLALLVETNVGG
jgi:uncharacterized protein YndB with AHSA1/START domain